MKRSAIVFAILTALLLGFIWGNSFMPKNVSASESGFLMELLKPLLDPKGRVDDEAFHHYLRKAAHFSEYAALGFCMSGFLLGLNWKYRRLRIPVTFLACVLTAGIDETIQVFSDGRGPKLRDVALDSGGAIVGIAVFCLLSMLLSRLKKRDHPPA